MSIVNRYLGKQKRNVIQPSPEEAKPEGPTDKPKFEKRPELQGGEKRSGEEPQREKPKAEPDNDMDLEPGMKIAKLIVKDRQYKPVFIEDIKGGLIKIKGAPIMKIETFKKLVDMGYFRVKR